MKTKYKLVRIYNSTYMILKSKLGIIWSAYKENGITYIAYYEQTAEEKLNQLNKS